VEENMEACVPNYSHFVALAFLLTGFADPRPAAGFSGRDEQKVNIAFVPEMD
jgi:hypothetical protein